MAYEHHINELVRTLMDRDGMTYDEARTLVLEARQRVHDGEDSEEILFEEFNLEPDYVYCLL